MPKGIVEIIFNFSEGHPIEVQLGSQQFLLDKCFINGFNTKPVQMIAPEKQVFFGARFHPTAIKHIFRAPAGEFANQVIDLALIDKSINSLWHELAEANSFENRIDILSAWVLGRTKPVHARDSMLDQFLNETGGSIPSVPELASSLCYSTRQLARRLNELAGINTEQVLVHKKFLLSIHLIHNSNLSLTQIGYQSQFSDQSHFIRNFKSFAGITPLEYMKQKSFLPGHLYN